MRVALAQTNPIVGDIDGNASVIIDAIDRAEQEQAELVVFPELALIGYPPKDLLLKPVILEQCAAAMERVAARCRSIAAVVGYPAVNPAKRGRLLHNAAGLCAEGRLIHRFVKHLLPTYDVFDESRYFEPAEQVAPISFKGVKLGVTICEDLWNDDRVVDRPLYPRNPVDEMAEAGADLLINSSASPFEVGKQAFRQKLFGSVAQRHGRPLIYVNQVGGNDELIFDGCSCVVGADGKLLAQAKDFEEDLLVVDLQTGAGRCETLRTGLDSVWAALVTGLRDYCRKCGFNHILLGLSGGIDSAVTACLAVAALGAQNVTGVALPSRYSSPGSLADAEALAKNLSVAYRVVSIEGPHQAMESTLAPLFKGTEPGLAEENIQARLRGNLLMAMSNKFGSLLVTTGNKSEVAVGYCTLYGDMCGGLAVLSDVPKTMVWDLGRWINTPACSLSGSPIPESSISKPPSAELRPDQTDQDSLPSYEVLDEIVERYVERHQSVRTIVAEAGFEEAVVTRMVALIDRNEYKRKQMPPGLKVTGRAFGFGRRMPIAQRHRQ